MLYQVRPFCLRAVHPDDPYHLQKLLNQVRPFCLRDVHLDDLDQLQKQTDILIAGRST